MKVIRIAQVPPPTVSVSDTITQAIAALKNERGCGVAVLDGNCLAGTLSKDDVLLRVVAAGRDPESTTVGEVMTSPPLTVTTQTGTEEALALMFARNQCFLPVVDSSGALRGWLAICHLFKSNLEDLNRQLDSLEAYIAADGPGG